MGGKPRPGLIDNPLGKFYEKSPLHFNISFWQGLYDLHGLKAYCDHPLEEFQGIGSVAHGLCGIKIGVINDAAGLVGLNTLAFHHPFKGRLAIDHIIIGIERNIANGDMIVIDHGADVPPLNGPMFKLGFWRFCRPAVTAGT